MVIAVTYENGDVYGHFGHANELKLYTVSEGQIQDSVILECEQVEGHAAMAELLFDHDVSMLICGNIGEHALEELDRYHIVVYPGVKGNADEMVEAFLSGNLSFDPNTLCNCHESSDSEGGCGCGGGCSSGCGTGCGGGCGCGSPEPIELPPVRDYEYTSPDGSVVEIDYENFDEEISGHGYTIIIKLDTDWAEPCKELNPRFEKLAKEYTSVKFCHVNCDEQPEIANSVQITNIPTMLIVKQNAIIDELIGAYPEEEIRKALDRAIELKL